MTIHFRSDSQDAVLYVAPGGLRHGTEIRVTNGTNGFVQHFSLTPKERAMLVAELCPAPPVVAAEPCYDWPEPDHVPGCEHERVPWDEEEWPDPADDPLGAGEPAF